MKKSFQLLFSAVALFSLIGCTPEKQATSSGKVEPSSEPSSVPAETYYHIIFKNDDGTVLEEQDVLEGSAATYKGKTPTKEEDDEFTYEFQGWDKEEELKNVISNITTVAQYKAIGKENWGSIIWF